MKSKFIQVIAELRRCLVAFGAIFVLLLSSFAAAPTVNVISINMCQTGYADGVIDTNAANTVTYPTYVGKVPGNSWISVDATDINNNTSKYPTNSFAVAWSAASAGRCEFETPVRICQVTVRS